MTADREYTDRLEQETGKRWKRLLGVQAPYRRHIRSVVEGRVLDIGCGIGRNLQHLDGHGVGVDINPHSIEVARQAGLTAHTSQEFATSRDAVPGAYDSLLLAHILEHMTPGEAGFRSDSTHVTFLGLEEIASIEAAHRLSSERGYSFPLPRFAGRVFTHNETVALSRKI